jgi:hypothetical protein
MVVHQHHVDPRPGHRTMLRQALRGYKGVAEFTNARNGHSR